jgi:hypothetical protein
MPLITDPVGYWDHYAAGVAHETPEEALKNAFGWTQYEDHGPGDELFGEPLAALELGSGRGNAVAALATKDIDATGIDISPAQVRFGGSGPRGARPPRRGRWRGRCGAGRPGGVVLRPRVRRRPPVAPRAAARLVADRSGRWRGRRSR